MQHSPAVNLLDAIRRECRLNIAFIRCPVPDGEDVWLIGAMDENGEAWFSEHTDLLLAAAMLEKLVGRNRAESDDLMRL